jgi:DNA repair protein RadD
MQLREYQSRSIEMLYDWMSNNKGHPCVVMPTGSGKSHVIAALCKDAIQTWPETRILMLTHVKELIEQNAEKMRLHWPGAPLGIYSASVGKRQLGEPITFAGIQSVRDKAKLIGHIDLIVIDECHLVNHKDEGGYRKLIGELIAVNPALRIIGYSATPYRLGHGLITDKPALFDALIEPISIEELIFKDYLSTLRSKVTKAKLDVTGVHKRGGEFIESELQAAVDTDDKNQAVVQEVMALAGERKAWLFFCAGVQHAQHIAEALRQQGVAAACVTGDTPKKQRDEIIADFKSGKLQALTNANVLTTGFDYPDIDLVVMLRPTMSASLYVQMAGRGMRVKSHTDHCLVLDFAGVVETHGPITNVQPPKKGGDGNGEAPVKACENCDELVHISAMTCPACGHPFPEREAKKLQLRDDDIMGLEGQELEVTSWAWREHTSKASGRTMLAVTYYGGLSDPAVTEYLAVTHDGYAGQMAVQKLITIAERAQIVRGGLNVPTMIEIAQNLNNATPPSMIEFRKDGKFFKVTRRKWE